MPAAVWTCLALSRLGLGRRTELALSQGGARMRLGGTGDILGAEISAEHQATKTGFRKRALPSHHRDERKVRLPLPKIGRMLHGDERANEVAMSCLGGGRRDQGPDGLCCGRSAAES